MLINPGGRFSKGGFLLNAGVSGRKVLADTYGGLLPHGGVACVGKDPLKPARSGTLMSRFVARELVRSGEASNVLVTAAYAFGYEEPIAFSVISGDRRDLSSKVRSLFDFRPRAIVERLNLARPIFAAVTAHGLFMHSGVPWEEAA